MAYKTKTGFILRNPAEKATRFSRQLRNGKVTETGKKLSATDRAFRIGYLKARKDSAMAFNANKRYKKR